MANKAKLTRWIIPCLACQGKKIISYEEGGSNGKDGPDALSRAALLLAASSSSPLGLQAWIVPVCGDSRALLASSAVMGACLCQPLGCNGQPFLPLLVTVARADGTLEIELISLLEEATNPGTLEIGDAVASVLLDESPFDDIDYAPPALAMGSAPEVICNSLGNTVTIVVRKKGLVVTYDVTEDGLELVTQQLVGQFIVDAILKHCDTEGGVTILLLVCDNENNKDGRVLSIPFRASV